MADESPDTEFLCDVLYADRDRLVSYLAQVEPNGVLTGVKLTSGEQDTQTTDGSINIHVAAGKMSATTNASEGQERTFDPSALLPISVMNRLDELGYIGRDLHKSAVGSLALTRGFLRLKDLSHINALWPILEKFIPFDMFKPEIPAGRRDDRKKYPSQTDIKNAFGSLLKDTPYPIQAEFMTRQGMAWSTFKNDCLLTSWEDLSLKHGSVIPGIWYVLGVVDAHPIFDEIGTASAVEAEWNEIAVGNEITNGIGGVLSAVRRMLGRPNQSFGITPLLVFRKMPANRNGSQEFMQREMADLDGLPPT
ncbi:hypothetical protein [Komagataeibacter saccharivorans]|uniref:hypothetical protein n=1 Tax=Komagataeibacter saccharivorans TaxID=265959 RepID=UPI000C81B98E|nr:hypothetical protein [Komagataeibacter saccharivorans]